ncbi:MAG: penicillin-binding protein [Polaromonas sp.]|nr:penicillin-binding protein [Polaromonas sp.]
MTGELPPYGTIGWKVIATLFIAFSAGAACATSTFDQIKRDFKPSDTQILSREGEVIQRLRSDNTVRRGQWVALSDISPALRTALVLSEDKRFYQHSGVDWRAASGAAWGNLWNTKTRGASTLSMQLAGLLDEDLRAGSGGRSLGQKIGQTVSSQLLESRWRKDQILEAYLNLVPFRGELVGIDALSRTLFGKAAHGLDEREAAVAAALVRAPNAKAAQVAQRACGVLKLMQPAASQADCDGLDLFATGALQRRSFDASEGMAPHLARRLVAQAALTRGQPSRKDGESKASDLRPPPLGDGWGGGSPTLIPPPDRRVIQSTLRASLQRFAVQTLTQQLRELHGRHVEDGAIVVLDNASGEVLAWVGSSGTLSGAAEVDGVLALRQPGSTLKPFLYAQAMADRRITAASLLEDSSAQIATAGGLYIPQNYDHQFKGLVSTRTALGASLNVPAVRALVMVSPDAFHRQLRAVGLPLKESGDYYGYSLALGSAEVSLLSLTNSYRTLANGGRFSETSLHRQSAPAFKPALDPRAAFIATDILADPLARARTFGTDSVLATRFWTAVKTGTSKDMRDNWAMGYSSRYTVGVWVGNASGAPMWDVSGTSGAAPIWAALMNHLHRTEPSRPPLPPAGVVQAAVRFAAADGDGADSTNAGKASKAASVFAIEAARQEWFLQGTEQAVFAMDSGASRAGNTSARGIKGLNSSARQTARITAPASGTIIAIDPDIPPNRQRVSFQAEGDGLRWLMDGKPFASGNTAQWLPWPGRHVARLVGRQGQVLDEVRLEVRGAGVKAGVAGKR